MRPLALLALVPSLLWLPTVAEAAPATCQGKPVTIVGKPGKVLAGTAGADVVVTNGASRVDTGDGDDLLCVTYSPAYPKRLGFNTGAGDDSVVVTGDNGTRGFLGDGDDVFSGDDGTDVVFAGYPDSYDYDHIDTGTDRIESGDGEDSVRSAGGDDVLRLGRGDDSLVWEGGSGEADGGPGQNFVLLWALTPTGQEPGTWVLDNRVGTLAQGERTVASWERFSEFRVFSDERLVVRGSAADEVFDVAANPLVVEAGRGDDVIRVVAEQTDHDYDTRVESLDGGGGRDAVEIHAYRGIGESWIGVDLAENAYDFTIDGSQHAVPLVSVEDAEVSGFPEVTLRGDGSANRLLARVVQSEGQDLERCRVLVDGRGGADRLELLSGPIRSATEDCPRPKLLGGAGNDLLIGARTDDRLLGGPGSDTARGGPGRDVCVAEVRASCER